MFCLNFKIYLTFTHSYILSACAILIFNSQCLFPMISHIVKHCPVLRFRVSSVQMHAYISWLNDILFVSEKQFNITMSKDYHLYDDFFRTTKKRGLKVISLVKIYFPKHF